jgi:hypothetical protein
MGFTSGKDSVDSPGKVVNETIIHRGLKNMVMKHFAAHLVLLSCLAATGSLTKRLLLTNQ